MPPAEGGSLLNVSPRGERGREFAKCFSKGGERGSLLNASPKGRKRYSLLNASSERGREFAKYLS